MVCYSSAEFCQDWRYAIEKDFTGPDGQDFEFARDGQQQWGDEITKLTFDATQPKEACVSNDGRLLAFAVDHKIHVYDTEKFEQVSVLIGHTNKVTELAFQPHKSNVLVSAQARDHDREGGGPQRTIIVWNIEEWQEKPKVDDNVSGAAAKAAAAAVASEFEKLGITLRADNVKDFETEVTPAVNRVAAKHSASDQICLHGRLVTHFQSQVFSPSGKWMLCLPGESPRANRTDEWDFKVLSTDGFKEHLTIKGHTDAIMWTAWSPDESTIATVAWDGTIRTWDAATGEQLHRFETNHQNWTGAFSPDSKYLAATDGLANVYIYDLTAGDDQVYWKFNTEEKRRWRRAMAWHPDGKILAVGGEFTGELLMLDVEGKQLVQERTLSLAEAKVDNEEVRRLMKSNFGVTQVQFVDNGKKLTFWTCGDASIEVYDLEKQKKWRFARGGTEDGPQAAKWRDDKGKVTSQWGHGMLAWEDKAKGLLMLSSIDFDGVRIWAVKLAEE